MTDLDLNNYPIVKIKEFKVLDGEFGYLVGKVRTGESKPIGCVLFPNANQEEYYLGDGTFLAFKSPFMHIFPNHHRFYYLDSFDVINGEYEQ